MIQLRKSRYIHANRGEFYDSYEFLRYLSYSPSEKSPSLERSISNCSKPFSIAEKSLKRMELGGLRLESRFCANVRDPRDTNLSKNGRIWRPRTPEIEFYSSFT